MRRLRHIDIIDVERVMNGAEFKRMVNVGTSEMTMRRTTLRSSGIDVFEKIWKKIESNSSSDKEKVKKISCQIS